MKSNRTLEIDNFKFDRSIEVYWQQLAQFDPTQSFFLGICKPNNQ